MELTFSIQTPLPLPYRHFPTKRALDVAIMTRDLQHNPTKNHGIKNFKMITQQTQNKRKEKTLKYLAKLSHLAKLEI